MYKLNCYEDESLVKTLDSINFDTACNMAYRFLDTGIDKVVVIKPVGKIELTEVFNETTNT